jgi:hypothetical protein
VSVDVGEPELRTWVGALLAHNHAHALRPGRQDLRVEDTGDLRDPGAVTDVPVGVDRGSPHVVRDEPEPLGDVLGEVEPDRVRQALPGQPVEEPVGAARGVSTHEHPASRSDAWPVTRQLGQGLAGDLDVIGDVVGDGVGAGVPGAQLDRERLAGARGSVVHERRGPRTHREDGSRSPACRSGRRAPSPNAT